MASIQKRTSDSGSVTYRVQVRLKGYASESGTFERLTDAKRWAQKIETEMREKRHFRTSDSKNKTLSELIERYLLLVKKRNPKRHPEVSQMLNWWNAELGHSVLADLSKAKIAEKIELLSNKQLSRTNKPDKIRNVGKTISASRVNRYLAALSHSLSVAVNEWEWLEVNPVAKLKKQKEPRGRVRFLSDAERKNLLEACERSDYKTLYLIVVLALSTGARKGEILNLRWDDIDIKRQQIVLHETKNGERRALPLTGLAHKLLVNHENKRDESTSLVFPSARKDTPQDIRPFFEKALKAAKISDFKFHDLRHSAASYMAMNGASPAEIAEVLGHKTLQMVKRYAHLSEAHTHSVVAKMNEKIFGS